MKYYTGVGSRETPHHICGLMTKIATCLASEGWTLRTGDASGADEAFRAGGGPETEVFTPALIQHVYEGGLHCKSEAEKVDLAMEIAKSIHPNWRACNPFARWCHARNVLQVLGPDPRTPDLSKFLICWTPGAEKVGGTRTAIVLAERHNVPVVNLADVDVQREWISWVEPPRGLPVRLYEPPVRF